MKIREVYDFNIGDIFHFRTSPPNAFPAGDRITVLDKYYSKSGDTLYYSLFHDRYSSTYNSLPAPHMDYFFSKDTELMQLTYLDSTLFKFDNNFINDTIYSTESLCGAYLNGYEFRTNVGFDTYEDYKTLYGKGLGKSFSSYYDMEAGVNYIYYINLIYYKKDNIECGTSDNTSIEDEVIDRFEVYPNPSKQIINITYPDYHSRFKISILDMTGREIFVDESSSSKEINIGYLKPGIYNLILSNDKLKLFKKIIKQ